MAAAGPGRRRTLTALLLLLGSSSWPSLAAGNASGPAAPPSMAVISRNVPAYASTFDPGEPPSNANGDVYDALDRHSWISSSVPAWIAYDLSAVPAGQRGMVDVLWINNVDAYQYDFASGGTPLGLPRDYTIDVNAAPGGTIPPAAGWVTLVTISGNDLKSREHVLDLTGYQWIRMNVTAATGGGTVHLMHLDVQDLSQCTFGRPEDSWIYFGDSITLGGLNYFEDYESSPDNFSFASLVHAQLPSHFPAQEDGGVVGTSIADALGQIDGWLAAFPGRYVGLSYGTNDASDTPPDQFHASYAAVVQKVLAAGKVPIVPTIPWGKTATAQANVPALNAEIQRLYGDFPQIVHGPDLWSLFEANPSLIIDGDVHPTTEGYGQMRQWWAAAMLANVYGLGPVSQPPQIAPLALAMAVRGANPTRDRELWVDFELPLSAPASVELLDVQGRRLVRREVGAGPPGRHSLELLPGSRLESGLYLVRLRQGDRSRTVRVTILR